MAIDIDIYMYVYKLIYIGTYRPYV